MRGTPEMTLDFVRVRLCRDGDGARDLGGRPQPRIESGGDRGSLNRTCEDAGDSKDCVNEVAVVKDCWNAAVRTWTDSDTAFETAGS